MSDSSSTASTNPASERTFADASEEELQSALFAQMVMQQASIAMMLMGKTPHPETGKTVRDLDAAKLFIDQLEMLEVKTKGNLNSHESALLKQSLMTLRLAFVEQVNKPGEEPAKPAEAAPAAGSDAPAGENKDPSAQQTGNSEEETRKKFSKTY